MIISKFQIISCKLMSIIFDNKVIFLMTINVWFYFQLLFVLKGEQNE